MKSRFRVLLFLCLLLTASAGAEVTWMRDLYQKAGPRLGCQLLEPDAVLALSGYTAVCDNPFVRGETDQIPVLNQQLRERGIVLRILDSYLPGKKGLRILSLRGLERISHSAGATELLAPYQQASGWAGYEQWRDQQAILAHAAWKKTAIGQEEEFSRRVASLLSGVPVAVAISRETKAVWAACPFSELLECNESQYRVPLSLFNSTEVVEEQKARSEVLRAVYSDPEIQAILSSGEFLEARRWVLRQWDEPEAGWWSDERGRLGLWTPSHWEELKRLRQSRHSLEPDPLELGERFFRDEQYEKALQAYRKAPRNALVLTYEGDCLAHLERNSEAEAKFREAVKLDPNQPLARRFLAKMLELRYERVKDRKLLEEALKHSETACKLAPGNGAAETQRARIQAQLLGKPVP